MRLYEANPALKAVLDAIAGGGFSPDEPGRYRGARRLAAVGRRPLPAAGRLSTPTSTTQARVDALYRDAGRLGARGDRQRGGHGQLLVRPHDPRVRSPDLEHRTGSALARRDTRWSPSPSNGKPELAGTRPPLAAGRALGRSRRQLRRLLGARRSASTCACSTPTGTHELSRAAAARSHAATCGTASCPAPRRAWCTACARTARWAPDRGPPLQPAQAAARPVRARDRRPVRLAARALRCRPATTPTTWTRATTPPMR